MSPEKRLLPFLDAVAESGIRAEVEVIGGGGQLAAARRLVDRRRPAAHVTFTGRLPYADTLERIAAADAALQIDQSVHDPNTAMGKFFFSILATFAQFEADVASQRTKEGLAIARAKGRLNGKPPKLSKRQHLKVLEEFESGNVTVRDLAEDDGVDRATIYRTVNRAKKMKEGSQ